ncbi:MAG: O-antigen polysaccharide polymerase Wzy [Mediterraneibacter gnavus]
MEWAEDILAVRTFESGIPSVFNFIEYMFMPFAVLMIVYAGKERNKPIKIAVAVWAILTALCGDRTTGIGALVVLIFLSYLQAEESSEEDKPSTGKKMVRFLLIIFLGVLLLLFIQIGVRCKNQGRLKSGIVFRLDHRYNIGSWI